MKNEILILDIETTGFLKQGGSIVEIGIASLNLETGEIKKVYDSLCREKILSEKHINSPFGWIFSNSDLTPEMVRDARPFEIVKNEVQEILNKYPLGCTAFNNVFDFGFLRDRGLEIKGLPCPMKLSTDICKIPGRFGKYKWPNVQEAYEFFFGKTDYIEQHRGADDAMHEAKIVYELYKMEEFKI